MLSSRRSWSWHLPADCLVLAPASLSLRASGSSQPDLWTSIDHPFPLSGDALAPQASRTEPPVRPPRRLPTMTEGQAGQTRPPDHPDQRRRIAPSPQSLQSAPRRTAAMTKSSCGGLRLLVLVARPRRRSGPCRCRGRRRRAEGRRGAVSGKEPRKAGRLVARLRAAWRGRQPTL